MKLRGISLRYKILIGLTSLPVAALVIFLFLAIRIFESDKIAYVYDSSLAVSKSKSQSVKAEFSQFVSTAQSIVAGVDLATKTLNDNGKLFFERSKSLQTFTIYGFHSGVDIKPNQQVQAQDLEILLQQKKNQLPADIQKYEAEQKKMWDLILKAYSQKFAFASSEIPGDYAWLAMKISGTKPNEDLIVLCFFNVSELTNSFDEVGAYTNFLVDHIGSSLIHIKSEGMLPQEWSVESIVKTLGDKLDVQDGTAELVGPNQKRYLVSYSHVGIGDMVVLSLVNRDDALLAVKLLLRKSILFFFSIFAITSIISVLASRSLTSSLSKLMSATEKIAHGQFDVQIEVKTQDEVGRLGESFIHMAHEVERLLNETAEKARMANELETARAVQETLFPASEDENSSVKLSGHYWPASECGGDWWFHCQIGQWYYIWIGDATGHGAPAALMTSAARAVASIIQNAPAMSVSDAMGLLNRAICDTAKGRMMMTFFLAAIDTTTGQITYSNASHEAPWVIQNSKDLVDRKDFIHLNEINNPRLGEQAQHKFKQASFQLKPGDHVVFYTDGVLDVKDAGGKSWGERRFMKTISQSIYEYQDPSAVVQNTIAKIREFSPHEVHEDDVTMISLKFKGVA